MNRWLWTLVRKEWQHHPWRHAVAMLAVALGVALAYSVHLINTSALAEFASALRSTNGEPDAVLRGGRDGFDDALFGGLAMAAGVAHASPVLEVDTYARSTGDGRVGLRVLGIDALRVAPLAPTLMPRVAPGSERLAFIDPTRIFVNRAARERLGIEDGDTLQVQAGTTWRRLTVGGSVGVGGAPLAVMDIAGAQAIFDRVGRLSRIDIRLAPGASLQTVRRAWDAPPGVQLTRADDAAPNVSQLSRAYRVNLTVLALVALFVGAFLVYSVVALSVAQRSAGFALLGVLGMTAGQRRVLVLLECAFIGAAGSAAGLVLGAGLALAALHWLAGDLGGGYFPGITPALQFDAAAALVFFVLGVVSALIGGAVPAGQAERLQPALALKGLGMLPTRPVPLWPALILIGLGIALAFLPPIGGLPLAAYASVALLLFGGVASVPAVVDTLIGRLPTPRAALPLLALRRAHFERRTATAAVAGVVASLALSVALTVMVASFRDSVSNWLDTVLPADLYARTAVSSAAADQAWLDPAVVTNAARIPGVLRVQASRLRALQLAPGQPTVTLIARPIGDPARELPLLEAPLAAKPGEVGVWVSEAMVALYGAQPGHTLQLPIGEARATVRVLGVWRDYARQFGAVTMRDDDYRRLSGDARLNDLALWLAPGADMASVQARLRALVAEPSMIEFAATGDIRAASLRIFDRSFAVTYYLQAVAIGVGLIGVAASLSAQVLARRKEFGLLAHLGLTRAQVVALVAGEALAWLAAGSLVGLTLGAAISVVLVHVVNPQSFHWTMTLVWPWGRLLALTAAVLAAGVATAAFSARRAAARAAVLSVKEDW